MMKKVLIGLVVLIGAFVAFVAMQPESYTVTRSATIAAGADVVFPLVSDFHSWAKWSPWDEIDKDLKRTYDGAPGAIGSSYGWAGEKTGEGKMTLTAAKPPEAIDIKLEFIKPFAATNEVTFTFVPTGATTAVTWKMDGHNNLMGKAAGIFMNFDKMVGGDFDKGLAKLKTVAEADAAKRGAAGTEAAAPAAVPAAPVQ